MTYDEKGEPGDEICSDTCGPIHPPAITTGHRYMVGYLDRKSHCVVVIFMNKKNEQSTCFAAYWAEARSFGIEIKVLRSDGGSEFKNKDMVEICRETGVKQIFSSTHTAEQNGALERFLANVARWRAMLSRSHLPTEFWEQQRTRSSQTTAFSTQAASPRCQRLSSQNDLSMCQGLGCLDVWLTSWTRMQANASWIPALGRVCTSDRISRVCSTSFSTSKRNDFQSL